MGNIDRAEALYRTWYVKVNVHIMEPLTLLPAENAGHNIVSDSMNWCNVIASFQFGGGGEGGGRYQPMRKIVN